MTDDKKSYKFIITSESKNADNINLSLLQLRTICECLYNFKDDINKMEYVDEYHEKRKELKLKDIEELFSVIEPLCRYKGGTFVSALEACYNRKNNLDIGSDALELSAKKYKEKT